MSCRLLKSRSKNLLGFRRTGPPAESRPPSAGPCSRTEPQTSVPPPGSEASWGTSKLYFRIGCFLSSEDHQVYELIMYGCSPISICLTSMEEWLLLDRGLSRTSQPSSSTSSRLAPSSEGRLLTLSPSTLSSSRPSDSFSLPAENDNQSH